MPSELQNILAATLGPALFPVLGVDVVYTPQAGAPVNLRGIFDQSDEARGRGQDTLAGKLWIQLADLPSAPRKGEQVEIDGATYRICNVPSDDYDGACGAFLHLLKR
jgi:hypothetical protein